MLYRHPAPSGTLFEQLTGSNSMLDAALHAVHTSLFRNLNRPLRMPATSTYSKADGIVDWHTGLIDETRRSENIEVLGASHMGLGMHALVLWALADRLAQPKNSFSNFKPSGPFRFGYGDSTRSSKT